MRETVRELSADELNNVSGGKIATRPLPSPTTPPPAKLPPTGCPPGSTCA